MKNEEKMIELLAPAGNLEKLKTALYFGADAVYLAGKKFGLRAFTDNFDNDELKNAVKIAHSLKKKVYITLNIFAYNEDFDELKEYVEYLQDIKVDAVIVSDAGILSIVKKFAPSISVHISTQSNITNKYAAEFYVNQGAERLVLARELNLSQIKEIRDYLPKNVQIEAFVHGAMCISYSGRCLLSNVMTNRASNRGECAQSCRWEYAICEKNRKNEYMPIEEDGRGTYILNSKDLSMIEHIGDLISAGIESFKIEGRVKTAYYVANTVNAYRRAIDGYLQNSASYKTPQVLIDEQYKASHREYCTGFYYNEKDTVYSQSSKPWADYKFCALIKGQKEDGSIILEQRNRFKAGDELEILSPDENFNKLIKIDKMHDEDGNIVTDALNVQQTLLLKTDINLKEGDILRKK